MGSKGSQQKTEQTSTATSAPNAQAGALYGDILNQLQGYVQQNPNAPVYQGERVAQFTPDQLAAMGTVNQAQGAYQPYMQQAGQFAQQAGSAITPGQISAAMSPYQQQVIDATMAQMGQRNAQQMSSLKGTEAQQGAFGGSRAAVTEATLGGQQNMNAASTLAGLNSQNYSQAVAQAQGNRAAAGTGAQLESGLGTQAMQLPFMGAQAQLQTGAQQQQLAQQNLNVPYENFLQQQAWTPQMLQFEAGLGTGVGSQMGGTTTNAGTTTTTPAQASPWMQAAGLGLSAAMMFSDKRAKENIEPVGHLNDGQKIYKYNYKGDPHTQIGLIAQEVERKHPEAVGESNGLKTVNYDLATRNAVHKADGGSVGSDIVGNAVRMARQMREGMAGGGVPGAGVGTAEYMGHKIPAIIPTSQMAMGKGAPSTPGFVSSPEMKDPNAGLMKGLGSGLGTLAKAGYDKWNEPMDISTPAQGAYTPMAVGDISSGTIGGTGLLGSGGVYSLGGTVSPESAYHGFAHRAYGGRDVVFDPTPISEQGGEDPNKAPVMPAEGFTDQPPSIVPAGEFKPYEAPPQADVPMPRPRPESLRVDDLAAAPMPIGAAAEAPVPMPRPRPAQTAAQPTDDIFPRVLQTESTGRQLDEYGNPLTSPKGAIGIAQIMPKTGPEAAKLAGLPWDEQKFKYDANYNATLGKAYFDHQTKVFGGDPEKGAAAYNAGPGRLREAMAMAAAHGGSYKDYLPAETQSYLGKVFGQQQDDAELPPNARPTAYTGGVNEPISQDVSNQYAPFVGPRGDEGGDRTNPAINVAAQAIVPKNDDSRKLPQNLSILERVLGKEFDPATRQAIMAAGLRMMTTPGNIGTVLGTAGMQGMATYSESKQMENAQALAQQKMRQAELLRTTITPYQQGMLDRENLKPSGYRTEDGHPIMYDTRRGGMTDGITGKLLTPKDMEKSQQGTPDVFAPLPSREKTSEDNGTVPAKAKPVQYNPEAGIDPEKPLTFEQLQKLNEHTTEDLTEKLKSQVDIHAPGTHPEILDRVKERLGAGIAGTIKAVAEGRQTLTSVPSRTYEVNGKKVSERVIVEQGVHLYMDNWEQSTASLRADTMRDLSPKGKTGQLVLGVNQLLPHLKTASDAAVALDNSAYPAANSIKNWWLTATGDPRVQKFNTVRDVAALDAARILRGGGFTLEEVKNWQNNIKGAGSPKQLQGVLNMLAGDLMGARMNSIEHSYKMFAGKDAPDLLSPHAKEALKVLDERDTAANGPKKEIPAPADPTAPAAASKPAAAAPSQPPDAVGIRTAKDGTKYYVRQDLSVIGPVK